MPTSFIFRGRLEMPGWLALGRDLLASILLVLFLLGHLVAADGEPPMTRIEYRAIAPNIAPDSFAAKPIVLYVAGTKYSRVEEQPDEAQGMHALIVCAEPNFWMANLARREGQHVVDPGPIYVTHHYILTRNTRKELAGLEYGKEVEFFRDQKAASLDKQSLDGQECEVSELQLDNYRLRLFTRTDTHLPFHLDMSRDGKALLAIRYLNYQTNLPFDEALFTPPKDIEFRDVKARKYR